MGWARLHNVCRMERSASERQVHADVVIQPRQIPRGAEVRERPHSCPHRPLAEHPLPLVVPFTARNGAFTRVQQRQRFGGHCVEYGALGADARSGQGTEWYLAL